ncbi:MAG: hypothetical protein JWR81_2140, partial [Pseudonocardia sp.]|nr:hypothetical protein [Pseudonocardia sp.]
MAVKFPESTKTSVHQRLLARVRERWPQIVELHVRHRGSFTYVQATTETTTQPLCRLRYVGSAHDWQVAIYRASHDDYQDSIFPSGLPFGTCQDALDLACGLYLSDLTAWQDLRACLRRSSDGLERTPLLTGCQGAVGESSGHGVDRGPADHGLGQGGITFVVAGQAAVRSEPRQRAFDRPPARDDSESALVRGLAHDLDRGAQNLCGPVQEQAGEPAVGEHEPRPGAQVG